MKLSLLSLATCLMAAEAFTVPKTTVLSKTALNVGVTPDDFVGTPTFDHKPIPPTVKEVKGTNYKGDVMLQHSYIWPLALAVHVPIFYLLYPTPIGAAAAGFHAILAALTWSQTNRVRLVMNKDYFELYNLFDSGNFGNGKFLMTKPFNYVKGGANRWYYKDINDLSFWPSQRYPFIVYFKETATSRDEDGNFGWWGKFAELHDPTSDGILPGQPHFMPGLFNVEEFVDELAKHGVTPRENYWYPKFMPKNK